MITGSVWKSLKLSQLIPDLDPEKAGSLASLLQQRLEELDLVINEGNDRVSNLLNRVSALFGEVQQIGTEIRNLQDAIDELIGNAAQTGVYVRFVGVCPTLGIRNNNQFATEVVKAFNDTSDPNRPKFIGETAVLGGFALLVGAADPRGLKDELQGLASVFPELKDAFVEAGKEAKDFTQNLSTEVKDLFSDLANDAKDLQNFRIPTPSLKDLFGSTVQTNTGRDKFCRWFALRVTDLIPALDPFITDTPANLLYNLERNFAGNLVDIVETAQNFENQVNNINTNLTNLGNELSDVDQALQELLNNITQTGVFFHEIGADRTVNNNIEFQSAVINSLNDTTDPNRPKFRGDTALVAGLLVVVGAPNAAALQEKMQKLSNVFTAIGLRGTEIAEAAKNVGSTLEVLDENEQKVRQASDDQVSTQGQNISKALDESVEETTYTDEEISTVGQKAEVTDEIAKQVVEVLRQNTLNDVLDATTNGTETMLYNQQVIDKTANDLQESGVNVSKRAVSSMASDLKAISESRDTQGLIEEAQQQRTTLVEILLQRMQNRKCENNA